jgi:hypothetical protein
VIIRLVELTDDPSALCAIDRDTFVAFLGTYLK